MKKFYICILLWSLSFISSIVFWQTPWCASPVPSGPGVGGLFIWTPTVPNWAWQSQSNSGACYVQCVWGYSGPTCQIWPTCTFNSLTIAQWWTITWYKSDIAPEWKTCEDISNAQRLVCSNGSLAGASTYSFASCLNPTTPLATWANASWNQSVDLVFSGHTSSLNSVNSQARQYLMYNFTLVNNGTGVATGVKVIYDLSDVFEEVNADTLHILSGNDLIFQLWTVSGQTQKTVTINVRVKYNITGTSIVNTATITGFIDSVTTNNISVLSIPVITLSTPVDTSSFIDPLPTLNAFITRYRWNPQFDCKKPAMSDIALHPEKLYIESIINNCAMVGYQFKTRNAFAPDKAITRGEWVVTVSKILNLWNPGFKNTLSTKKSSFSDVTWSLTPYITWSQEQWLITDMIDTTKVFKPNSAISQQDAKSVLFKIFKLRWDDTKILSSYLNSSDKNLKRGDVPKTLIRLFQKDGYLMVGQNVQFLNYMSQRLELLDLSKRKPFVDNLISRINSLRSDRLTRIWLDKETLLWDLKNISNGVIPVTNASSNKSFLQSVTSDNTSTVNPWEDLLNKSQ